jgi:hypothetical protein
MAFDFERNFDGSMTISETESSCEIAQDGGFELQDIHFDTITDENGNVFQVNTAGFNEKLSGILKNLHFVEIKDNDNPQTVRKTKEDAGWTFICDKQIFVENFTKRVMVFGKKSF